MATVEQAPAQTFVGPCTPAVMAARHRDPAQCLPPMGGFASFAPCRETVTYAGKTGSTKYAVDLAKRRVTATNHWDDGKSNVSEVTQYDAAGNASEWTSFKNDGSVGTKARYIYDAQGRLVQTVLSGPDLFGPEDSRYEYDEAGKLVGVQFDADADSRKVFSYDADGRVVRSGTGAGRVTAYEYDAQGRLIAERETNNGTQMDDRFIYENAKLVEKTLSMGGTEVGATRYTYDAQGHLLSETSTGVRSGTERYEYDKEGRRTLQRSFDKDGKPDGVLDFGYECPPPG